MREASNDDPWGPSGTLMQEIARLTYQYTTYDEVMAMLWKRMFENKKNWRRIYKVCDSWSEKGSKKGSVLGCYDVYIITVNLPVLSKWAELAEKSEFLTNEYIYSVSCYWRIWFGMAVREL